MARKVTVPEKFFVEQNMDKLKPTEIATSLGWKLAQVKNYIEYLKKSESSSTIPQETKPKVVATKSPPPVKKEKVPIVEEQAKPVLQEEQRRKELLGMVGKTFARHSERPVTGMTESESEIADEFRKAVDGGTGLAGLKSCVHRPFGDSQKTY